MKPAHGNILVQELRRLSPFDPEHLPEEILLTDAFQRRVSELPQVACFDTAFHHDLPRVGQTRSIFAVRIVWESF